NNRVISREAFFHLVEVQKPMHCTDETWDTVANFISRGRGVQCFDTMEALRENIAQRSRIPHYSC
ncbi:MAG TPA: hypothetical protein VK003_07430, partial [Oceanobacillus sp.]|nr:hypothetical protein [Oceanobacillus sp.]